MPRSNSGDVQFPPSQCLLSPRPYTAWRSRRAPRGRPDSHLHAPAPPACFVPTGLGTPRGHLTGDHLSSIVFSELKLDPSGGPEELKCFPNSDRLSLGASSAPYDTTVRLTAPWATSQIGLQWGQVPGDKEEP